MAGTSESLLSFEQLERDLDAAIAADTRYVQQNDAKFRAIKQGVATYDEFREIVQAAHLRALDKQDKINIKPKTMWNSLASKKKHSNDIPSAINIVPNKVKLPANIHEFDIKWQKAGQFDHERFQLLKQLGENGVSHAFCTEISFGVLGEMIHALLQHEDTLEDFVLVVRTLEKLTYVKRFVLTLQFLTATDKAECRSLFLLLKSRMSDKLQDLADCGITEWTMQELMKKYEIFYARVSHHGNRLTAILDGKCLYGGKVEL